MEKKTIGKFIAVLRKANGMTQKELGERLFVSDKTVSRWERDECEPELSLIPAIAEIFGVTADELLRGEKNAGETELPQAKAKSEKQFDAMLRNRMRRYRNLSVVSVALNVVGLLAAAICNLEFSKGTLAFCISLSFFAMSALCQFAFQSSARICDDEDDDRTEKLARFNEQADRIAWMIWGISAAATAFCLPLVTLIDGANFGLKLGSWVWYGVLFALLAVGGVYALVVLFAKKYIGTRKKKLLLRCLIGAGGISLLLCGATVFVNIKGYNMFLVQREFTDAYELKDYLQAEYDDWNSYNDKDVAETFPNREYIVLRDAEGEYITSCYYNPDLYYELDFEGVNDDRMPAVVCTQESYYRAWSIYTELKSVLFYAITLNVFVWAAVYLIGLRREV